MKKHHTMNRFLAPALSITIAAVGLTTLSGCGDDHVSGRVTITNREHYWGPHPGGYIYGPGYDYYYWGPTWGWGWDYGYWPHHDWGWRGDHDHGDWHDGGGHHGHHGDW